jgi:hypothetical protein
METQGFYKKENEILLFGNNIIGTDIYLFEINKDKYEYPVDDWYWFDDEDSAYTFFGIEKPVIEDPQNNNQLL